MTLVLVYIHGTLLYLRGRTALWIWIRNKQTFDKLEGFVLGTFPKVFGCQCTLISALQNPLLLPIIGSTQAYLKVQCKLRDRSFLFPPSLKLFWTTGLEKGMDLLEERSGLRIVFARWVHRCLILVYGEYALILQRMSSYNRRIHLDQETTINLDLCYGISPRYRKKDMEWALSQGYFCTIHWSRS